MPDQQCRLGRPHHICRAQASLAVTLRFYPLLFDGVVMKAEKARSAKPCDGLVAEQMDGAELAEDEEIKLVR
jgi:hypothetical protein